ncbi:MAG: hypothetical protein Q9162_002605 [Coniocarpon cinnabarinum]
MAFITIVLLLCSCFSYSATLLGSSSSLAPQTSPRTTQLARSASNIPLLIWHGLGDAYDSDGIQSVGQLYNNLYPSSLVYFVHLGESGGADRHASFFGNVTEQVEQVCDDIRKHVELSKVSAVNALGFSQGGVFLRGLVERCDAVDVRNLITFGSPHSGITQFAQCAQDDWWCKIWSGTLKGNTWSDLAQSSLVPAQYFRSSADIGDYLQYSNFLADVNNERERKSREYRDRISALKRFVMFKFQDEDVIQPPESSWFADYNVTSGLLTRLKERDLYKEEWLGLKKLDEAGGLEFRTTPGKHMQIQGGVLEDAFKRYFAVLDEKSDYNDVDASAERPSVEGLAQIVLRRFSVVNVA